MKLFQILPRTQDHNAAFKSKTTMEVVRALVVFQLCGINKLVDNNEIVSFLNILLPSTTTTTTIKTNGSNIFKMKLRVNLGYLRMKKTFGSTATFALISLTMNI